MFFPIHIFQTANDGYDSSGESGLYVLTLKISSVYMKIESYTNSAKYALNNAFYLSKRLNMYILH